MAFPTPSIMDYTLYSRQLILPGFGLPAQQALLRAKVAVVGAGGLGCPALTYLALSGVGHITVIDHDTVDLSNLARQSLHSRASIGTNKALSAQASLAALAPNITVTPIPTALDPTNAISLLADHDLILDCTDNPATRYLLNDSAVALHTPLVSAAGQQYDGQLAVYNYRGGPCLRCVFPKPPAPQFAPSCSEVGVLGPVVATIGSLQALEAIKILANLTPPGASTSPPPSPHMLLFSALATPPFRSIKLRNRKPDCIACSNPHAPIDVASTDYIQLCGGPRPDWESLGMQVRDPALRIDANTLSTQLRSDLPPLLIDVRPPVEFGICQIEGVDTPTTNGVDTRTTTSAPFTTSSSSTSSTVSTSPTSPRPLITLCRLGNDSQLAADALRDALPNTHPILDLIGGLRAWARDVEPGFPVY
ncbi:uncharacterized protein SCHCODRAFT_02667816 [Schizophyllum commune H4-8]|uniref:Rhodanese domain-containing protein n=1 Tax=Schizophyllum commune (strain H4-8 / FGSC 9210) TaxID=578458 RepID=D8Q543_SCHCM|nr:uncharacterized protein SCHCODRAFT_02667816 [Schizophyllum commune H4-8]KAI5892350.1 hypothetical protein SCHCODRAFT_02667816 [Schizophyllum commune H4-8]